MGTCRLLDLRRMRALAALATLGMVSACTVDPEAAEKAKGAAVEQPPIDDTATLRAPLEFFDPLGVHAIELTVAADQWVAYLDAVANPTKENDEIFYPAQVTIDGTPYANIGIRRFGAGSQLLNPAKPNVRIKFDQFDQEAEGPIGLHNLRLKASGQDPTFLREPLTNHLVRELGGSAPRTSWARLTVNGEPYGLYQVIEQIDKQMFDELFGNKDGNVYDPMGGCVGLNCPAKGCEGIKSYYEAKPGDYQTLVALATAIATAPEGQLAGQIEPLVSVDRLLAIYAVEAIASNHDGLLAAGHNFEIYQDSATGKLEFIGRSMDLSLGVWEARYGLDAPWGDPNTWCKTREDKFYRRAYVEPVLKDTLMAHFKTLQCGPFAKTAVKGWLRDLRSRIHKELAAEPKPTFSEKEEEASYYLLEKYVDDRHGDLGALVGKTCPADAQ